MTRIWMRTTQFVAALALTAGATEAQRGGLREVRGSGSGSGGLGVMLAMPVGQFSEFVDVHSGVGGAFTFGGPVGLRLAGSLLVYGHERVLTPWAGGRILLDVTTNNMIGTFGVGPQITLGRGPVRLYGYGTVGVSYFTTVSSLGDACGCEPFANTTSFDDVTLAREAGGGLQVALTPRGGLLLDLSARYLRNGRATYLTEGGIVEEADGSVSVRAIESEANLVVFQMGLAVRLR